MMKKAREVIEAWFTKEIRTIDPKIAKNFADGFQKFISDAGFVILPKEPSEGMIEAGVEADDRRTGYETVRWIYSKMISHAEGEKG